VMTMMARRRILGSPRNVENMMCSWTVKPASSSLDLAVFQALCYSISATFSKMAAKGCALMMESAAMSK
jgi:hypothetical protein